MYSKRLSFLGLKMNMFETVKDFKQVRFKKKCNKTIPRSNAFAVNTKKCCLKNAQKVPKLSFGVQQSLKFCKTIAM